MFTSAKYYLLGIVRPVSVQVTIRFSYWRFYSLEFLFLSYVCNKHLLGHVNFHGQN